MNLIVTTKQKQNKYTKEMRKESKLTLMKIIKEGRKRRKRKEPNGQKTIYKIVIRTYLSIITLNINGLHSLIKNHIVAEWIKKDTYMHCLQESNFRSNHTHRFNMEHPHDLM